MAIPIMCFVRYAVFLYLIETVNDTSPPLVTLRVLRCDCLKARGDL